MWQSQIEIENYFIFHNILIFGSLTSLIPRLSPHKWGEPGNEANASSCEKALHC